jgi:uncharacterized protein with von Willebrand factor type A (vWA) domain
MSLSQEPVHLAGVHQRVIAFLAALRRGGVATTPSVAIDALRALGELDLLKRTHLREALAAVCVTTPSHRPVFDDLFDLYFPLYHVPDDTAEGDVDPDAFMDALRDALNDDDTERVRELARQAVDAFGRVDSRDGIPGYFQYRVFRALDMAAIEQMLFDAAQDDRDSPFTPLEEQLAKEEFAARVRAFEDDVAAEIRRRAAEQRGLDPVAKRTVQPPLDERDLFHITAAEQRELRGQIQPLARKLASRVAVKRRSGRDGRLDMRRTVRRSLATGGIPFEPSFRPRRPHKPELFVICDVSGSVASFARFTLLLVHALQSQFAKVRSFAFIDTIDEVTSHFDAADAADAMQHMLENADLVWLDGHSDYGHALLRFHERYAQELTPRSTVLILGDARNNYRQASSWVVADMARRARHVYWLNPEPLPYWDTGDSIAATYARHVDEMVEVRNLRQLAAFVERIA